MEESWSTFSESDVFGSNVKERQSIAAIKGRDDLADICDAVTGEIRQAYLSGGRALGAEGTIPDGLKARAAAIALWRFVSAGVPRNENLQTQPRHDAFDEATAHIEKIARRELTSSGSAQTVSQLAREATRARTDGLI